MGLRAHDVWVAFVPFTLEPGPGGNGAVGGGVAHDVLLMVFGVAKAGLGFSVLCLLSGLLSCLWGSLLCGHQNRIFAQGGSKKNRQ